MVEIPPTTKSTRLSSRTQLLNEPFVYTNIAIRTYQIEDFIFDLMIEEREQIDDLMIVDRMRFLMDFRSAQPKHLRITFSRVLFFRLMLTTRHTSQRRTS